MLSCAVPYAQDGVNLSDLFSSPSPAVPETGSPSPAVPQTGTLSPAVPETGTLIHVDSQQRSWPLEDGPRRYGGACSDLVGIVLLNEREKTVCVCVCVCVCMVC